MCVISIEVLSAVTMKWEDYNMLCEIDCFCFFFIIRLWPYQFTYISPSNNSGEIISFQIMDSTTCKINAIIIWIKTFTQHKSWMKLPILLSLLWFILFYHGHHCLAFGLGSMYSICSHFTKVKVSGLGDFNTVAASPTLH